jgi:hypothetical protein
MFIFSLLVCLFGVFFLETISQYSPQVGLKLLIFLPLPFKCWDYIHHQSQVVCYFSRLPICRLFLIKNEDFNSMLFCIVSYILKYRFIFFYIMCFFFTFSFKMFEDVCSLFRNVFWGITSILKCTLTVSMCVLSCLTASVDQKSTFSGPRRLCYISTINQQATLSLLQTELL